MIVIPTRCMVLHIRYVSTRTILQYVFSGFSVGFCISEEGYLLPNIARKTTC